MNEPSESREQPVANEPFVRFLPPLSEIEAALGKARIEQMNRRAMSRLSAKLIDEINRESPWPRS